MDENALLEAIGQMIDRKLDTVKTDMSQMMDRKLETVKTDMSQMMDRKLETVKTDMSQMMDRKLEIVKTDMSQMMDRKLTVERENTRHMIQDSANGIRTLIETDVNKRIGLLIDGHTGLAEKLNKLEDVPERIEDIQNTVSVLKSVFSEHIRE